MSDISLSRRSHSRAASVAVLVTVLWSSSWVLIRWGLDDHGLRPLGFAGLRYVLAALLLGGWAASRPNLRVQFRTLDRPIVLRQAMMACRKGGTVSVPGVYGGFIDKIPFGAVMNKGLTIKTGQTHVHRYMRPLLHRIQEGQIDPSSIITHRFPMERFEEAFELMASGQCGKVILIPPQS